MTNDPVEETTDQELSNYATMKREDVTREAARIAEKLDESTPFWRGDLLRAAAEGKAGTPEQQEEARRIRGTSVEYTITDDLESRRERKEGVFVGTEKEYHEFLAREAQEARDAKKSPGWLVPKERLYKTCVGDQEWCQIQGNATDGKPARHYHTGSGKVIPLGDKQEAPLDDTRDPTMDEQEWRKILPPMPTKQEQPKVILVGAEPRRFYQPPPLRIRLLILWAWLTGRKVEI